MLHGRDTHLFTRTTDPMTLTCRGLHLNAYGRHSAVRFSHQQHLHLPCLPPKNPPSGLNLTKISLPARTSFVVRTYILTPALSPTNSAFRCTWQQVLLTFPPLGTSPRLCGPWASLTTYVLAAGTCMFAWQYTATPHSSARARSVASRYAGQRLSACAGHMCACRGQYLQQLPTRRWQRAPGTARTAWRAVDGAFNSSLACALVECAARVQ